jgi:predicted phosphodiesterase
VASWTSAQRARSTFGAEGVGLVLFGHSHAPLVEQVPGGPLLVNPGSPTDKRAQPRYSWALVEISGGEVRAELRFFDDRSP